MSRELDAMKRKPRVKHSTPRMSETDLREFVLDWCDGRVTSSHEVPSHLVHVIFMPLGLGALAGWTKTELKQIGLVYAVAGRDTHCGMGINGYPVYAACRMMHRLDWDRARLAIDAELDRRKAIKV